MEGTENLARRMLGNFRFPVCTSSYDEISGIWSQIKLKRVATRVETGFDENMK